MKEKLTKDDYKLYFHPAEGVFRFVVTWCSHIPLRNGHVEAVGLPFTTPEDRDMFRMLYPLVNVERMEEVFNFWVNFEGDLIRSVYSLASLRLQGSEVPYFM